MADERDPSGYRRKLQTEIARIRGDETERRDYSGLDREQDIDDLLRLNGKISDRTASTRYNLLGKLRRITEYLEKPLAECSEQDFRRAIIDRGYAEKDSGEYSTGTKRKYLWAVRTLAKELGWNDNLQELETPSVSRTKVNTETVLSQGEVFDLINNAVNNRVRAFIALQWDCCYRKTAALALKIKHIEEVNENAARIKTPFEVEGLKDADGNPKPTTVAKPYLDAWLRDGHPCSDDGESAIFCRTDAKDHYGDHMSIEPIRRNLKSTAVEAGLEKSRVYVHAFRHARATFLKLHDDYTDMDIEQILDWDEGSQQHKRYAHVKDEQKVNRILRKRGVDVDEDSPDEEMVDCPQCLRQIPLAGRMCPYCGSRIDSSPPSWYGFYRRIVDAGDPVKDKYDGKAAIAPEYHELPKTEYQHVKEALFAVVMSADTDDEVETSIEHLNIPDDISESEIDEISRRFISNSKQEAKNFIQNQAEYELDGDDDTPRELAREWGLLEDE